MVFKKLFTTLNNASVKYLVAGGIAVNLYGIERATADIDVVLWFNEKNLSKFLEAVKKLGLRPKIPVRLKDFADSDKRKEWIKDKNMVVFSLYDPINPFFLLDIFIDTPFDFERVYKKRMKIKFEEITIPVVPLKELIKMKDKSDRPQDRADVFYLKKIMREWKDEK